MDGPCAIKVDMPELFRSNWVVVGRPESCSCGSPFLRCFRAPSRARSGLEKCAVLLATRCGSGTETGRLRSWAGKKIDPFASCLLIAGSRTLLLVCCCDSATIRPDETEQFTDVRSFERDPRTSRALPRSSVWLKTFRSRGCHERWKGYGDQLND